ncbi:MAG TPA: hypothetical protein DGH68_11375, partial [Bacteroidetes bacterium]|nr:hypothetical protein [Bacteroidota bacterium]
MEFSGVNMKKLVLNGSLILAVALSALLFMGADQRTQGRSPNSLLKPTGTPTATLLNINRYSTWYSSNGEQERNPYTTNSGTTYPRGTSQCIYSAGLIWGGMFYDGRTPELRVNGQSYENGTKPGAILGFRTGRAEDPGSADVRIWRIRRDYKTMSTSDAKRDASELYSKALSAVTDGDVQRVRDQYEKDWMEWPAVKGAPYYDKDGDGVYNPTVDEPGVAGADQVIWYVCNDIGQPQPWLCPETGMEEQVTIWGYARTDPLGNIIFKKFRLIYKGTSTTPATATVENMYLCQWSDPDLGNSGDDYAACDTVLSMNYVYNSGPVDANYALFNLPPPAAGYDFLQGPMVRGFAGQDRNRNGIDDAADFAIFDLKKRGPGVINLPMTSAMYFAAGQQYSDPPFTYLGAIQWYQMLRGLPPTPQGPPDPAMRINPTTNQPTPFWVSGDPVAGTGWLDNSPGDRRILLTSGPFTMAVGDTQELVSALVAGLGSNNLQSISTMKFNDKFVQTAYDSLFKLPGPPEKPSVAGVGLSNGFDGTRIMVNWGLDSASIARTESVVVIGNYRFEGYKLYQFPDASGDLESAILIGQYDLRNGITVIRQPVVDPITGEAITMPVQYGSDNGIPYTVTLERDAVGGVSFVPGQRYYYGITAYNYCYDALNPTKTYESQPATITVIPETARPGDRFPYFFGDTIAVSNAIGTSNAVVIPLVYNPYLTKGTTYRLRIDTVELGGVPKWSLKNMTSGKVLTSNRTALAYPTTAGGLLDLPVDSAYNVTESGFKMYVVNSQTGVRTLRDANGANVLGRNSSNPAFDILTVDSTTNQVRGLNGGNNNRDFELRFDATGSFALRSGRPPSTQAGSIWV